MSAQAWTSPVGGFLFAFFSLEKLVRPKKDAERQFLAFFTVSVLYTVSLVYWLIPAMNARVHGSPQVLYKEIDVVAFCSVLWVVEFFAGRFYEGVLPTRDECYPSLAVLGHAAWDTYAVVHLEMDTFVHKAAMAACTLLCIRHAYRCFCWLTDRQSHSKELVVAMRAAEFVVLSSPIVSAVHGLGEDETVPAHVFMYTFVVAAYWQVTMLCDAEMGMSLTQPPSSMVFRKPTHLLLSGNAVRNLLANKEPEEDEEEEEVFDDAKSEEEEEVISDDAKTVEALPHAPSSPIEEVPVLPPALLDLDEIFRMYPGNQLVPETDTT